MGNAVTIVMSYRLWKESNKKNKEKDKKNNIYNYLYGKRFFKDVSNFSETNPLLRKKKDSKDL
jgi:hypothetical protein